MFRLLINSRDELALAAVCQAPGLELAAPDFLAIRRTARVRDLPMYQVRGRAGAGVPPRRAGVQRAYLGWAC